MIWLVSDLHLCHNRNFLYEPRGFMTSYEMDEAIVKNWNSKVSYNDDVYILGDIMLNNNDEGIRLFKCLKGQKHIIRGNHDTDARIELYKQCYNTEVLGYASVLKYGKYHFYLSHYPTLCSNYDDDKPLERKMINLCGHTHTKDKFADWDKGLIYHCELDAHENYPVSLDDIIEDIKEKIKR